MSAGLGTRTSRQNWTSEKLHLFAGSRISDRICQILTKSRGPPKVEDCKMEPGLRPKTECPNYVRTMSELRPNYVRTMSELCPNYVRTMSELCPNYVRTTSELCPNYVRKLNVRKVTSFRQILDIQPKFQLAAQWSLVCRPHSQPGCI